MSSKYLLSQQELDELEIAHRQASDKRLADRVKTVYLLGKGWTTSRVAEALLIDRGTVRNHFKRYRKGGIEALRQHAAGGSQAFLNEEQQHALERHLKEHFYLTAKEVAHYVKQTWGVSYSENSMTQLLKRMGYVYKKPKLIPGKANAQKQREFIDHYHELKAPPRTRFTSWMPYTRTTILLPDTAVSNAAKTTRFAATPVDGVLISMA